MKVTVCLINKLLKSWFDEIIFWWERISRFSTQWDISLTFFGKNFVKAMSLQKQRSYQWVGFTKSLFEITEFSQKLCQINVLLKNRTMNWFDGKKICVTVNFSLFLTVCRKIFHFCLIITDRHITNFGCLLVCQEEALTEKCSVGTQVNEEDLEPRTSEEEGRSIVST